jgi:polyisoprenoid-binding protein YceI
MMTGSSAQRSRRARRAGPRRVQRAGFSATAQISRRDFAIDLTIPMDGGGVTVGDEVSISLEIEAVLQK